MIPLLDTSDDLTIAENEIGCKCGELLTPLTRRAPKRIDGIFAIDNGAFANFDAKGFLSLLEREKHRKHLCKFVAVPDVVGSARRTQEVFDFWFGKLSGWKLALVAQDGLEDLPINWKLIDAIFIGGSTKWKESNHAAAIVKAAKAMDKWVHIGRINTPARFEHFEAMGADSCDGTGLARYSWMREKIYMSKTAPQLFQREAI